MREFRSRFEQRSTLELRPPVPELVGRKELGSEIRKRVAGSFKLSHPEHGLFVVSDGEGSEVAAAMAAREVAKIANAELGEKLDRMIENNERSPGSQEDQQSRIDALIRTRLIETFGTAVDTLRLQSILSDDIDGAGFKAAIAKVVALPGGQRRLYVAHVGDARVFIDRGGQLYQLTQDHTPLRAHAEEGRITPQEVVAIDQATEPETLSREHRHLFATREEARALRTKDAQMSVPEVQAYRVEPGDRVVIINAGVNKNMLVSELAHLARFERDDRLLEDLIQRSADDEVGRKHPRGRSVAADMAAVVYSVDGHSGDRQYLRMHMDVPKRETPHAQVAVRLLDEEIARLRALNASATTKYRAER